MIAIAFEASTGVVNAEKRETTSDKAAFLRFATRRGQRLRNRHGAGNLSEGMTWREPAREFDRCHDSSGSRTVV